MSFMFEKLRVYQRAVEFAAVMGKLIEVFPHRSGYLSDQLGRASLSIATNIAEGNGRWHTNDRKQFFWIARGSAQECIPILEVCLKRGIVDAASCESFKKDLEEISRMLDGLIKGVPEKDPAGRRK